MTSKKQGTIRQLAEAPAPTESKQASGMQKVTGDPAKRDTSSAKLTEATTIEFDEFDVVNYLNRPS
jgi:hypothetical protein